ncbi:hypothetical protein [Segetibacter aerophilus]|uniref:50S ribosomal protein L29 n=1 Tax=Segetibacter aerophilus TaxID=670293 RepID=A0A512BJN3_9BACT|nr:hypothetical protein [Segetibacter aerophilus]GEO12095.1 hypothetical protein SAE01_45910 [Segetibacter aerophilus]
MMGGIRKPTLSNKTTIQVRNEILRLEEELLEAKIADAPSEEVKKLQIRIRIFKGVKKKSKV